jgi:hypothetical protein
MIIVLAGLGMLGAVVLIGAGIYLEGRKRDTTSTPDFASGVPDIKADLTMDDILATDDVAGDMRAPLALWIERLNLAVQRHPVKVFGVVESLFWLALLIPLFNHALDPSTSTTAGIIWYFTILPHELGHLICMPFGEFIMFSGGSIWQVLPFLLLGAYWFWIRRFVTASLLALMLAGHSFINMSVYIADAQERELDLLFGLDKSSHDWWNILGDLGLLSYDDQIAALALLLGVGIVLLSIITGILMAWLMPRTTLGPQPRYEGSPFKAMRQKLKLPEHQSSAPLDGGTPMV